MLSGELIKEISQKQMTVPLNIAREYFQILFLKSFYLQKGAERLLFKGGTALRLAFGSPRYSTDLDFNGDGASIYDIENYLQDVLVQINREEKVDLLEAKKTTGGYLAKLSAKIANLTFPMKIEISFRDRKKREGEVVTIANEFIPGFMIYVVKKEKLIKGKISALLARAKPRDYYDLYFILRKFMSLKLSRQEAEKIFEKVRRLEKTRILQDLKPLLPKSHHMILRNFKDILLRELERVK